MHGMPCHGMHVWHLLELPIEATFSLTGDIPTTIQFIPIYKNSRTQPIIRINACLYDDHTHKNMSPSILDLKYDMNCQSSIDDPGPIDPVFHHNDLVDMQYLSNQ